ncbi:MAG: hypothetical protein A3H98_09705 [Bacteroidetes bacterium RIFCSPLOWO2_02_FULL_36_8]|nr:MAG: hypothetical protein A3H98_09705 [Bacteroidetes bacterium RIFCSPLOWO2_02_FULL_36_8]OFY68917.1 MAG: hypothetical protein A3G23_02930 [Bacteroidetes bacterium RIFCSPLOWO2_12_FULL_37_12]
MKKFITFCDRKNLTCIRGFLEKHLTDLVSNPVLRNQIIMAVDEVCSNAMIHANQCNGNELEIRFQNSSDKIIIEVIDKGRAFNFSGYKTPEIKNIITENRKNGLGMILIKKIMDTVEFKRRGERNICRMSKKLVIGN